MEAPPQFVRDVQHDQFIAGVDVITTNCRDRPVPYWRGQAESGCRRPAGPVGKAGARAADAVTHKVHVAASVSADVRQLQAGCLRDAGCADDAAISCRHSRRWPISSLVKRWVASKKPQPFLISSRTALPICGCQHAGGRIHQRRVGNYGPAMPLSELLLSVEGMRFDALLFNCSQPEVMADAIVTVPNSMPLPASMVPHRR